MEKLIFFFFCHCQPSVSCDELKNHLRILLIWIKQHGVHYACWSLLKTIKWWLIISPLFIHYNNIMLTLVFISCRKKEIINLFQTLKIEKKIRGSNFKKSLVCVGLPGTPTALLFLLFGVNFFFLFLL